MPVLDRLSRFASNLRKSIFASKPDAVQLGQMITPNYRQTMLSPAGVTSAQQERRNLLWQQYFFGNPAAITQKIQATQSEAAAQGFVYLRDVQLYDLFDEMMDKDLTIKGALKLLANGILRREERITVTDENDTLAMSIRDACQNHLLKMKGDYGWQSFRRSMLIPGIAHGFSANEIIWRYNEADGLFVPDKIMHRHPGQFAFDGMGNLLLNLPDGKTPEAPPFKFALYRRWAFYANPYGQSELFALRWFYWLKKEGIKAWAEYCETYGLPIAVATVPATATEKARIKSDLENVLANIRRDTGIVLSNGEAIEWAQRAAGQGKSAHEGMVNYIDFAMVRYLVGAVLNSMEAQFGSRAQADTHQDTSDNFMKSDASVLAAAIQNSMIGQFVELNWGPDAPVPVYEIDVDDARDVAQAIQIIDAMRRWGMSFAQAQAREWMGARGVEEGEEEIAPAPNEPPPPMQSANPANLPTKNDSGLKKKEVHDLGDIPSKGDLNDIIDQLEQIASELAGANQERLFEAIQKALSDLQTAYAGQVGALPASMLPSLSINFQTISDELTRLNMRGLVSAKALSLLSTFKLTEGLVTPIGEAATAVDPLFADAFQWMRDRKIASRAQVNELTAAVQQFSPGIDSAAFEQQIRNEVFALAKTTDLAATAKVQDAIASAINEGTTISEFFDQTKALIDLGQIPGGTDAYLETVFRTEIANAYGAQQKKQIEDPTLAGVTWGVTLYNPHDDRSRPSHAAINGLMLRKGSAAYIKLMGDGGPPFDYNCRCVLVVLYTADPSNPEYEEPENAYALVSAIERF